MKKEIIIDKRFGEKLDLRDFLVSSADVRAIARKGIDEAINEVLRVKYPFNIRGGYDDSHTSHAFNLRGIPLLGVIFYAQNLRNDFDFWQFPHETVLYMIGDCEDTSILLGALFAEQSIPFRVNVGKVYLEDELLGWHAWITYQAQMPAKWLLVETTLDEIPETGWFEVNQEMFKPARVRNLYYVPVWVFNQIDVFEKNENETGWTKNVAAEPNKIRKIKEEWKR